MDKPSNKSLAQARHMVARFNELNAMAGNTGRFDSIRQDADETNMLALQLEDMRSRVYEDVFAPRKSRLFFPASNDVDTGAETYAYTETTEIGQADIINNFADDLPTAETSGVKVTHNVVSVGIAYHWSLQDVRRAAFSGQPLPARKAVAARRAFERKLDDIAASGAADDGIASGAVNNANVSITALAAAGVWSGKTGAQIVADLNDLVKSVVVDSKEAYMADTVLMPLDQYMLISQTEYATGYPATILETFLRNNPSIQRVEPWEKLDQAGAASADRVMAFMSDPEIIEHVIPQEFEVLPPEARGLGWRVACHGRTAGIAVHRPLGVKYLDGV